MGGAEQIDRKVTGTSSYVDAVPGFDRDTNPSNHCVCHIHTAQSAEFARPMTEGGSCTTPSPAFDIAFSLSVLFTVGFVEKDGDASRSSPLR